MVVGEFVTHKQVIVIGGGPGGYHAAIRAAQLGLEVLLVEKEKIGGVCLNEGCIPSKLFAHAARQIRKMSGLDELGIRLGGSIDFDLSLLQQRKEQVIERLSQGVIALLEKYSVEVVQGKASFISAERIGVERGEAFDLYESEHVIISTGSGYTYPAEMQPDHQLIFDANSIYQVEELPKHLLVYGSDYLSLEVASTFSAFGTDVTIIMDEGKTAFPYDSAINRELFRQLKKAKIKCVKQAEVHGVTASSEGVKVDLEVKGEFKSVQGSHLYVAAEPSPNIEELQIQTAGIDQLENGLIATNEAMETSVNGIYAIGDVTSYQSLAVTAIRQGKVAAENCAGKSSVVDTSIIPHVIHFLQPVATTGLSEEMAKELGYEIKTGQFSMRGSGYAEILNEKNGFVKTVSEQESGRLLGFHAVGEDAIGLINQGVLALEMVAREEDLTSIFYPHPSLYEAWTESIEDIDSLAIHKG
ncbi:dihydrolipoyl dehydrogenase family protein [Halobacillus naozhouensis]|uniref:FAD-dependent oxidoreductase n=1 Tax=Halobacillus naozhouensis TaxID=554880 RepID=A0ABY8J1Z5_9BACI|nr:FAD-dependent oxidoreductase [Halobacillus naozhouensis]WFT75429.1 FAD-dependent oxidoreductase [Halobacillus naozhouensis]